MKSKLLLHKVERSSSDIISTLPQTILETILCLLQTKEAARTSILSREWRYKWSKIPKLTFYLSQVSKRLINEEEVQGNDSDRICKLFHDLHQILVLHQGPIHEFTLYIDLWGADLGEAGHVSFGLNEIILHLSKNHTVKKLTLHGWDLSSCHNLPMSVFSLHRLTDLDLFSFDLDYQPIFSGFSSLRNLELHHVRFSTKSLLQFLSDCPSLKSLTLLLSEEDMSDGHCTIIDLFKCLSMIEHLTICGYVLEWLFLEVPKELPTSLFHLKFFCFEGICFADGYGLAFLLVLIKCSPNLEKIKLEIERGHECLEEYSVVWKDYSDVWLEHLIELEIEYFNNSKPEMEFVKFILARSPKLKKVSIRSSVSMEERLVMLQVLLRIPRASPVVIYV